MKTLKELQEAKKTVAFTFGRFNPPTTGHEKLIKEVFLVKIGILWYSHLIPKTQRRIHFPTQEKSHT